MSDATEQEAARRAHEYEMGADSASDRAWYRWSTRASAAIIAEGWGTKFDNGQWRKLDGAEAEDGYSLDGAYEAWEAGQTVGAYLKAVRERRQKLGLIPAEAGVAAEQMREWAEKMARRAADQRDADGDPEGADTLRDLAEDIKALPLTYP